MQQPPFWLGLIAGALLTALGFSAAIVVMRRRLNAALNRLLSAGKDFGGHWLPPKNLPNHPILKSVSAFINTLRSKIREESIAEAAIRDTQVDRNKLTLAMTGSGLYEPPKPEDTEPSGIITTNDLVSRLDPSTLRWIKASSAEQEYLGRSLEQLRGLAWYEVVHPKDRKRAEVQLRLALDKGEAHGLIYRVLAARGELKVVELNASVRYLPDRTPAYLRCHLTDVTAEYRARKALRRRSKQLARLNARLRETNHELLALKDRYRDLYQNSPTMYFSLDPTGKILVCNETMLRALGYSRQQLLGRMYTVLLPAPLRERFQARQEQFLREGRMEVESSWLKADGAVIDVLVTATAVRDAGGKIIRSRSVAQDITTRNILQAELQEKNTRLAAANVQLSRKIKELDEFSYVVSHDLKEPLRTLIAFSDFLKSDCEGQLGPQGLEYLNYLVDAARRMRALIDDLLKLSRAGRAVGDFAPVDLTEMLTVIKADLAQLIRDKNAEVTFDQPLPTLWGDRIRITQLFINLISNGLKYNHNEKPTVHIEVLPSPDNETADSSSKTTIAVRDNGIGIDPEFHGRIFLLFRRLHAREEFEGTGAGLAICQKIVQAHGGIINVESVSGEGSTFLVTLPVAPAGTENSTGAENGNGNGSSST